MKLLKEKYRVGQEVWEHNGRKVSLVNLISEYIIMKEHLTKIQRNTLKRTYEGRIWEYIELPTKKNKEYSNPARFTTKKEARIALKKYLLSRDLKVIKE